MNVKLWQGLRIKQAELDDYIMEKHRIKEDDVINERIAALLVELAELLNEMPKTFKYWSKKENDYEKGLVELVDNLHFILSIENHFDFTYKGMGAIKQVDILHQFNEIVHEASSLMIDKRHVERKLTVIRGHYLGLTQMLGFTTEQVIDAYNSKYEINIKRQVENY